MVRTDPGCGVVERAGTMVWTDAFLLNTENLFGSRVQQSCNDTLVLDQVKWLALFRTEIRLLMVKTCIFAILNRQSERAYPKSRGTRARLDARTEELCRYDNQIVRGTPPAGPMPNIFRAFWLQLN
jgi:hypothetical protein